MNFVHEDPDVDKKRIFIEHMGMNVETLSPRFGEFFSNVNTSGQQSPNAGAEDTFNKPIMQTVNGMYSWGVWSDALRLNENVPGVTDPWFCSLDYNAYPGKELLKTSTGLIIVQQYSAYSTNDLLATIWIGTDMTGIPTYQADNNSEHGIYFYEDSSRPNEFYCIKIDNGTHYLGKMLFTASATPVFTNARGQSTANVFFVGRNTDDTCIFQEVNGLTQNSEFYKLPSTGSAIRVSTYEVNSPGTAWHYSWPSNIRTSSPTRNVFYQGTWQNNVDQTLDQYKQAEFHRFIHDPTNGTVVGSPCTVVYPAGTTHIDYQTCALFTLAQTAWNLNAWYYKCHQFTINGTNYLTFYFVNRSQHKQWGDLVNSISREKQNRWVTFTIGTGENDNVLTYHSTWEFTGGNRAFPRYMAPIDASGTQLLYIKNETVSTLSFDVVKGWFEHDVANVHVRSYCIDSVGRIYLATNGTMSAYETSAVVGQYSGGTGYHQIWQYEPSRPTVITVEPATTQYIYQGTNISSTLIVDARDFTGTRISVPVTLTIGGGNVTFSDGSVSTTVITSSTTTTSVGILIKGGGRPTILASVS
jgi:hypothetical protein